MNVEVLIPLINIIIVYKLFIIVFIVITKTTAWAATKCLFSRVTKVKMNQKRNNDIQKLWIMR